MLYTIYPPELIYQSPENRHYFTLEMDGRTFVMELLNGQAQIVRLISPNPQDYLNPKWQPGTKVGFMVPGP